jgi:hypothetical protein
VAEEVLVAGQCRVSALCADLACGVSENGLDMRRKE